MRRYGDDTFVVLLIDPTPKGTMDCNLQMDQPSLTFGSKGIGTTSLGVTDDTVGVIGDEVEVVDVVDKSALFNINLEHTKTMKHMSAYLINRTVNDLLWNVCRNAGKTPTILFCR